MQRLNSGDQYQAFKVIMPAGRQPFSSVIENHSNIRYCSSKHNLNRIDYIFAVSFIAAKRLAGSFILLKIMNIFLYGGEGFG
ncbi:hypothetical protein ACS76_00490 [Pantoea vagans]|nr:hypothetical protein ACS76_00490 [Pantoea vagans]